MDVVPFFADLFAIATEGSMYRRLMLEGQIMSTKEMEASDGEVDVDLSRVMGASDKLIEKLLLEYCGNREQPFEALMDSEYGDDYETISNKFMEVFGKERELPKEWRRGRLSTTALCAMVLAKCHR